LVSVVLAHPIRRSAGGRALGANSSTQSFEPARPDCIADFDGW
jgi:hypothetical protein